MCMMLYLAAPHSLPLVEITSCWAGDEDSPPDADLTVELTLPRFFEEMYSHGLAERQLIRLLPESNEGESCDTIIKTSVIRGC